jgi:hypothetical protein
MRSGWKIDLEMNPLSEEKKKKPLDLTLGHYHPEEKQVELADGTKVILENPRGKKTREEVNAEHSGEAEGHKADGH